MDSTGDCKHGTPYRSMCEQCREEKFDEIIKEGTRQLDTAMEVLDSALEQMDEHIEDVFSACESVFDDFFKGVVSTKPPVHKCIHGIGLDSCCSKCMTFEGGTQRVKHVTVKVKKH